jgi:Bacterial SH3 domain/Peptidase inhibitor family I36
MNAKQFSLLAVIATVGVLASSAAALAAAAVATSTVNVRQGPGPGYAVVDVLHHGDEVDIIECTPGWCHVDKPGPNGWVSKSYLALVGGGDDDDDDDDNSGDDSPNVGISIGVGPNGPSFGISVGDDDGAPAPAPDPFPTPSPAVAQVCFYSGSGYSGSNFCTVSGDYDDNLAGSWNNNISSISIEGSLSVYVCDDANYGPGNCQNYSSSKSSLGGLNNKISSYQTN